MVGGFSDLSPENTIIGGTDETTIGNVGDRLKVDASFTGGNIPSMSALLRYKDMNASNGGVARGTSVTNAVFVDVFSQSASGLLFGFSLSLEGGDKEWEVKLIVDGNEIFGSAGILTSDLEKDSIYGFDEDTGKSIPRVLGFDFRKDTIRWEPPLSIPMIYSTNVTITVKRQSGKGNKKFRAGLVAIS